MSFALFNARAVRQLRQVALRERLAADVHEHGNVGNAGGVPGSHQVTERQRLAQHRAVTKIEVPRLRTGGCNQQSVDPRQKACTHDFADTQGRSPGHGTCNLQCDPQCMRLLHTSGDLHRQAICRHNVPADTGQ
ncbi:hypothetical protein D9M73_236660 [compost metagenome]